MLYVLRICILLYIRLLNDFMGGIIGYFTIYINNIYTKYKFYRCLANF